MGTKNNLNSYSLLNMGMKEIEKSNKKKVQPESMKSNQNSNTESSPDVIILSESKPKQKGSPPVNQQGAPPINKKETPPVNQKGTSKTKNQKIDHNVPDYTYGDLYCALCDAHMNSEDMWNSHIIGKRHQKNLKKGDRETKYEDLEEESAIKYELRNVKDAIVGLSYIQERRKREVGVPPLYTCFLCQSNFATSPMVIEHLISMKHRLNYIKENSPDDYQLLDATNLKKPQLEPLVSEMAVKLQEKFGSGTVKVKQEKEKPPYIPSKRPFGGEDDMVDRAPISQKRSDVWQRIGFPDNKFSSNKDYEIIEERKKRFATSVEEADIPKQKQSFPNHSKRYRSPSPYYRESSKRERSVSRISHSSQEDYRSYSRLSSPVPNSTKTSKLRQNCSNLGFVRSSRKYSTLADLEVSPSQETLRNETYSTRKVFYSSPGDEFHSRSSQLEQKDFSSSKMNYSSRETKSQQLDSDNDVLRNFCLKMFALPGELFLKLCHLKLKSTQIDVTDLEALGKVIKKAQIAFCENFPVDSATIKKMLHKTESSHLGSVASAKGNNQTATSISKKSADISFLGDLIKQAKDQSSVSSNVASHPNAPPYPGSMHGNINPHSSYDYTPSSASASSTIAAPTILGQTSGPYSAYNTQQYSDPSSPNIYPEYKHF